MKELHVHLTRFAMVGATAASLIATAACGEREVTEAALAAEVTDWLKEPTAEVDLDFGNVTPSPPPLVFVRTANSLLSLEFMQAYSANATLGPQTTGAVHVTLEPASMEWFEVRSPLLIEPGALTADEIGVFLARQALDVAPYDKIEVISKLALNVAGQRQEYLVKLRLFPGSVDEVDAQNQNVDAIIPGACGVDPWFGAPDCNGPRCRYEKLIQHTVTTPACMIQGGVTVGSGGPEVGISIQCPINNEHSYTYEYKDDGTCWAMDGTLWNIYCECHPTRPPNAL